MMKKWVIVFLATLLLVSISGSATTVQAQTVKKDIIVHIDKLVVTDDSGCGLWDTPDPYLEITVYGPRGVWQSEGSLASECQDDVDIGEEADDLNCTTFIFKNVTSDRFGDYRLDFEVWDDDPWTKGPFLLDDPMGKSNTGWIPPNNIASDTTKPANYKTSHADLWLTITFKDACSDPSDEHKVVPARHVNDQSSIGPSELTYVTLALNVNETYPPTNVNVTEYFSEFFTFVDASPMPQLSTINLDGESLPVAEWTFSGLMSQDVVINYTLRAPDDTGTYIFRGKVETGNLRVVTAGQWQVSVEQPVGGIWIPVDKFGLLAPYIGLASTIIVATAATAIYVKRRKKKQ